MGKMGKGYQIGVNGIQMENIHPPPLNDMGHAWYHPMKALCMTIRDSTQKISGNMPAWGMTSFLNSKLMNLLPGSRMNGQMNSIRPGTGKIKNTRINRLSID
jgi:hypothetical protein